MIIHWYKYFTTHSMTDNFISNALLQNDRKSFTYCRTGFSWHNQVFLNRCTWRFEKLSVMSVCRMLHGATHCGFPVMAYWILNQKTWRKHCLKSPNITNYITNDSFVWCRIFPWNINGNSFNQKKAVCMFRNKIS